MLRPCVSSIFNLFMPRQVLRLIHFPKNVLPWADLHCKLQATRGWTLSFVLHCVHSNFSAFHLRAGVWERAIVLYLSQVVARCHKLWVANIQEIKGPMLETVTRPSLINSYIFSDGGWVTGACTGYFSSLIHTRRVIPFGVGFPFLFTHMYRGLN